MYSIIFSLPNIFFSTQYYHENTQTETNIGGHVTLTKIGGLWLGIQDSHLVSIMLASHLTKECENFTRAHKEDFKLFHP